jgi:hypothetical protein
MAALKIATFLGKAPKISPELLPNTAAQIAQNCKLYSGDLIPYPAPVIVGNSGVSGEVRSLYGLRDLDDPTQIIPLAWPTDVDVVVASANLRGERRFYYTGDGAPKVSDYELATSGPAPYPAAFYELGLPVPPDSQVLTTVASVVETSRTTNFSRDSGSTATIETVVAHGLRTGNIITITGFTYLYGTYTQSGTSITVTLTGHGLAEGASVTLDFTSGNAVDGTFTITNVTENTFDVIGATSATTSGNVVLDIRSFNATNVECTVLDETTFTYFSPGFAIAQTDYSEASVDLGGLTQARSYVFTWFTPWEEESIASKPSDNLFIKEGVSVTVSDIPTQKPDGNNFVRGVRLYRSLASLSGTEYFRLATLWFPTQVVAVSRDDGVSTVELEYPHNLDFGERFKLDGCSDASFDIEGVVLDIIDAKTFTYTQAGADTQRTTVSSGLVYHDVSENPPVTDARYWGFEDDYDFLDDFDSRILTNALDSDDYDPPPVNLQGLVNVSNNILVGFVGNTLFFSEPDRPHAWPARYAVPVGAPIVALTPISGSLLVLTKSYPYIVTVTDPAAGVSLARIDVMYPCLSAKSVVTMGYGVVWSTNDGLAVYSPASGAALVTKVLYNNDTWTVDIDPTTVVAEYYGENYIAAHSRGAFIFEQDTQVGGFFVDADVQFSASWFDPETGRLYYAAGTQGDIYEWDDLLQPALPMQWKSKVIVTPQMLNLGAARVIADYETQTLGTWSTQNTVWSETDIIWNLSDGVLFSMWVDKEIVFTTMVNDDKVFRLPTGYRTDTFEVAVEGTVRVRAIHLGETPSGLRSV